MALNNPYALNFIGTGNKVSFGQDKLKINTGSLTLEVWVCPTGDNSSYRTIFANRVSATAHYEIGTTPAGKLYYFNGTVYDSGWVLPKNTWSHLAVTVGSNGLSFYINGEIKKLIPGVLVGQNIASQHFVIGNLIDSDTQQWIGKIDEIRIWNIVRTQNEIKENNGRKITNRPAGLIGYIDFDEGSGISAFERLSSSSGTLFGTTTWVTGETNLYQKKFLVSSEKKNMSILTNTIDLIPTMTSNTAPFGIVSASTHAPDLPPWKAFNKTALDYYDCWATLNGTVAGWLQYELRTPSALTRYSVRSRNNPGDINDAITSAPKDWIIEGSNDGTNYSTIHTIKASSGWTNNEERIFQVVPGTKFKFIRIRITANNGKSYTSISEFKIIAAQNTLKEKISSTVQDFIQHGMDPSAEIDLNMVFNYRQFIENLSIELNNGRVYKTSVNSTEFSIKEVSIINGIST